MAVNGHKIFQLVIVCLSTLPECNGLAQQKNDLIGCNGGLVGRIKVQYVEFDFNVKFLKLMYH